MDKPYWEVENPAVVEAGRQRYKYYKQSGILEICTVLKEGDSEKEIRRETLSAYKLQNNIALCNLLLDFLEDAKLIRKAK